MPESLRLELVHLLHVLSTIFALSGLLILLRWYTKTVIDPYRQAWVERIRSQIWFGLGHFDTTMRDEYELEQKDSDDEFTFLMLRAGTSRVQYLRIEHPNQALYEEVTIEKAPYRGSICFQFERGGLIKAIDSKGKPHLKVSTGLSFWAGRLLEWAREAFAYYREVDTD